MCAMCVVMIRLVYSAAGERDVFNEKPSREEIYAATEVGIVCHHVHL